MPPCGACGADIRRFDVGTRWRRKLLLWSLVCLACAGLECAALAQDDQNAAMQNHHPPEAIRQGCSAEHTRYCVHEAAGTSADVACLQQHHLDLTVKCRDRLEPPDNGAAPPIGIPGPGGMPDAEPGIR